MTDLQFRQAVVDCLRAVRETLPNRTTAGHVAMSQIDRLIEEHNKDLKSIKDHEHG